MRAPPHDSWSNQVALWFSILNLRVLRHGQIRIGSRGAAEGGSPLSDGDSSAGPASDCPWWLEEAMEEQLRDAADDLHRLLETDTISAGLYVRVHGKNLIIGREEPWGPDGALERDDRLRLTRLASSIYGLSVKRHTGRWEQTPFRGDLKELVEVTQTLMQHLIAPYS